jgi:precorrin-3B synthase
MPTGDGLLVRLQPIGTVPCAAFVALCAAARRHGNGVIEVTSRGNIQIRGLGVQSAPRFAADVAALDIAADDGVSVLCNPLAGLEADECVDTAALADELRRALARRGLAARLRAKTSIVIESGGALDPADVAADIRLSARPMGGEIKFAVAVGGNRVEAVSLGLIAYRDAREAATRLLEVLVKRGRHCSARDIVASEAEAPFRAALAGILSPAPPESRWRGNVRDVIGAHTLRDGSLACGVGLAFGHSDAKALERLADAAGDAGASGFRGAPGRALLAIGVARDSGTRFTAAAETLGFISRADDPRRGIVACAGAPICGAANIAARAMAPDIAAAVAPSVDGAMTIHVSGCAKGCAHAGPAAITVVGTPDGCALVADGKARDAPFAVVAAKDLTAAILRFAGARMKEGTYV